MTNHSNSKAFESNPVMVELSTGASIPLRPITAKKSNNVYHATLKTKASGEKYFPGAYGVKVNPSVVGGSLPTHVIVGGTTFQAEHGKTQGGNTKVSFKGAVSIDGNDRTLRLSISALPDGNFNVSGSLTRAGGAVREAASAL